MITSHNDMNDMSPEIGKGLLLKGSLFLCILYPTMRHSYDSMTTQASITTGMDHRPVTVVFTYKQ